MRKEVPTGDKILEVKNRIVVKANCPKYYPFITRTKLDLLAAQDWLKQLKQEQDSQLSWHLYRLHSLANSNFGILEVYLLYFPNFFQQICTKERTVLNKLEEQKSLSIFFEGFLQLACLRILMSSQGLVAEQSKNELKRQIQKNFDSLWKVFEINRSEQQRKRLIYNLKQKSLQLVQIYYQEQLLYLQLDQTSKVDLNQKLFGQMLKYLIKIKKDFTQKIEKNINKIMKNEGLIFKELKKMSSSGHLLAVKHLVNNMFNIHVFSSKQKIKRLQEFITRHSLYTNCLLLKQPKNGLHVVLIKSSTEQEPVCVEIVHYLNYLNYLKSNKKQGQFTSKIQNIKKQMVVGIMNLFYQYYQKTGKPYPFLTVNKIFFDQKKLKATLSQSNLILDALGLQFDVCSIELRLAVNSNPDYLGYESCHLEKDVEGIMNQQLMRRFYNFGELQKIQNDDVTIRLQQQISVWRLICVIYFIMNQSKNLVQTYQIKGKDFKSNEDEKNSQKYQDDMNVYKYWNRSKDLYQYFGDNPKCLKECLKFTSQSIQGDVLSQKFDYSIKKLKKLLSTSQKIKIAKQVTILSAQKKLQQLNQQIKKQLKYNLEHFQELGVELNMQDECYLKKLVEGPSVQAKELKNGFERLQKLGKEGLIRTKQNKQQFRVRLQNLFKTKFGLLIQSQLVLDKQNVNKMLTFVAPFLILKKIKLKQFTVCQIEELEVRLEVVANILHDLSTKAVSCNVAQEGISKKLI